MFIVCIHYSIFWSFFKIFSFIFLKLILRMYLLRRLSAPQAKKFGFFTHFKGFSIHFSCNANFGTERPVSSFRRFSSFRSVPPKTEIVPFFRSVLEEERERRTERNGTMPSRNGKTLILIYMLYPICSFIRFAHWAKRMSDLSCPGIFVRSIHNTQSHLLPDIPAAFKTHKLGSLFNCSS